MCRRVLAVLLPLPLASCSVWFFSGESWIDRSQPVALVETTGGVELGATTEFGVLTLGRTATAGPCRVHYFLGPTPVIEDGELAATASLFTVAEIDLKTMALRAMDRSPSAADELLAMWTPDGTRTERVAVQLARDPGVTGDVLRHPGRELPVGAAVFADSDEGLLFVGLVAGKAEVTEQDAARHYFVFAGVDRIREMLATPIPYPTDLVPKYRTDDISVMKPAK
jgi:hypothetical protein